jgi:hypothetical protein
LVVGGNLLIPGFSTGVATITQQTAQGTPTLTLPTATGTFVTTATAPLSISATTGAITLSNIYAQKFSTTVDFNVGTTDTSIAITLPTGFTRYRVIEVEITGASHSLSTATAGLFTAAAGAGVAIVTAASALTLTATADATNNNAQLMTINSGGITTYTAATLFWRVATPESAAATATVSITIVPYP